MELRPYTSYKGKDYYYVILDLIHAWPSNTEPGEILKVVMMNVQTEEKKWVPIEEFKGWLDQGTLKKIVST